MKKIFSILLILFVTVTTASANQCGVGKSWNEFSESCVTACQFGYKWNNYTQSCIEDDMEEQEEGCDDDEGES